MGRQVERGRALIGVAAVLAATAAGCTDSGLPGRNTELAVADTAGWPYPAYEAGSAHAVRVWDQDWMVAAPSIRIPADLLVEIARDGQRGVFALATDSEPYSRLYLQVPEGYSPMARSAAVPR